MRKTLLSIAIIAALPITANATGPAHDSGNSPVVATASAPYQTVTPEAHADEHIASTKYVIGAYNDAIAAVNKVDSEKQGKLRTFGAELEIGPAVIDADNIGGFVDSYADGVSLDDLGINTLLITAGAVIEGFNEYMYSHPITIYTTWDDDTANATTQVAL